MSNGDLFFIPVDQCTNTGRRGLVAEWITMTCDVKMIACLNDIEAEQINKFKQ